LHGFDVTVAYGKGETDLKRFMTCVRHFSFLEIRVYLQIHNPQGD